MSDLSSQNMETNWRVLLLGGSSGTGKSVAAQRLGRRFGIPVGQVDDFRLVLQREISPVDLPMLHFFTATPSVWRLPAEKLCEHLIAVGELVSHALEVVVAHHLLTPYPIILEGDGIVPAMAAQSSFAGMEAQGLVKAVFLYEPEEGELLTSMRGRGRGFDSHPSKEQRTQVRMSWLYGLWLKRQAEEFGLLVAPTRPKRTLMRRILAELGSRS